MQAQSKAAAAAKKAAAAAAAAAEKAAKAKKADEADKVSTRADGRLPVCNRPYLWSAAAELRARGLAGLVSLSIGRSSSSGRAIATAKSEKAGTASSKQDRRGHEGT